jgi:hypothetical protein
MCPIFTLTKCGCLSVTVRAENSQILKSIVSSISINVVKLKRKLLAIPHWTYSTTLAFFFLKTCFKQFPFNGF